MLLNYAGQYKSYNNRIQTVKYETVLISKDWLEYWTIWMQNSPTRYTNIIPLNTWTVHGTFFHIVKSLYKHK